MERWAPGTTVLHRNVYRDEVWFAAPVRVVEDSDDGVVTWLASGTSCLAADIGGLRANVVPTMAAGGWGFRDHRWFGWGQLLVWPAGCAHTVWPMHDTLGGELTGWYLNLQAPVVRGPARLDTLDLSSTCSSSRICRRGGGRTRESWTRPSLRASSMTAPSPASA